MNDLQEAKLVLKSCDATEQSIQALVHRRVDAMRQAVEQARDEWRSIPLCKKGERPSRTVHSGGSLFPCQADFFSTIGQNGAGRWIDARTGQEQVDQADVVKSDGAHVYIVERRALRIFGVDPPRLLSATVLTAPPGIVNGLLVSGDRAAVFVSPKGALSQSGDCSLWRLRATPTSILVFDISDRARPKLKRQLDLTGALVTAHSVGQLVRLVVSDRDTPEVRYQNEPVRPSCLDRSYEGDFDRLIEANTKKIMDGHPRLPILTDRGETRPLCDLLEPPLGDATTYTTVISFDLVDDTSPPATVTMHDYVPLLFASQRALYFAQYDRRSEGGTWFRFAGAFDDFTGIHVLRMGANASDLRYVGAGVVPGVAVPGLADERDGYLRILTTSALSSTMSVLAEGEGGALVRVGAVDGIARGKYVRTVRFDGDRAYVALSGKRAPLLVVSLASPTRPTVLGELEIPGFSMYLHRIDPSHLVSIGLEDGDQGSYVFDGGLLLQMFDVSEPTRPVLLHKEKIGGKGTVSAAEEDDLAFTFDVERGLLALPISTCDVDGADGKLGFRGLLVYDVAPEGGFVRRGSVSHAVPGIKCRRYWAPGRAWNLLLDRRVFSMMDAELKIQDLDRLGRDVASFTVDGD